jgi:hypothetical protein
MKTVTFYVVALLCFVTTAMNAQSFEERAAIISKNIEKITQDEKDALKAEVDAVNTQLENNEISAEQAEAKKKELSEKRAKNIEERVAFEEDALAQLVKDKVDGKITDETQYYKFKWNRKKDTINGGHDYRRTSTQFVYALGVNRMVKDGAAADGFKWRSDFYEVGLTWNTRLAKEHNLLHAKYGLSLQYNNLRPDNDMIFVKDGGQTVLAPSGRDLDVSRLRYVNLVVPAHLEFDFTKKEVKGDKVSFPTHKSLRVGLGGYAGVNVKEKQIIKYGDGNKTKSKTKGDFNVSDFVYGVSAYVAYGEVGIYAKYDLQPVFNNNEIDYNNFSLGMRFDFN